MLGALGWLWVACVLGETLCVLMPLLLLCCFVQA